MVRKLASILTFLSVQTYDILVVDKTRLVSTTLARVAVPAAQ
jgi:hypothetical protein